MKGISLKMRFLFFSAIALIALTLSGSPAYANDGIEVRIDPHSKSGVTSSSTVTVTVQNVGEATVYIPKPLSPFYAVDDHMVNKLFSVVDAAGDEVPFTGRYVRMIPEDPDWYLLKIEAGHSLSQEIDLSKDYDLSSGGTFQVSYRQGFTRDVHTDSRGQIDSEFEYQASGSATIWIDPSTAGRLKRVSTLWSGPADGQQCDSTQYSIIHQATARGWSVALDAIKGIESLYSVKEGKDDHGNTIYRGQINPDNAYTYWFGAPENKTQAYFVEPKIVDYWKSNDDYLMMRFMNSIGLRLGTGTFYCGCDPRYDERSAGWTDPAARKVTLCNRFFRMKFVDGAYDSQVLTILHEVSHYVDGWGPGTGDYTYGMYPSHSLARKNRHEAVKNADNIMYYMGTYIRGE